MEQINMKTLATRLETVAEKLEAEDIVSNKPYIGMEEAAQKTVLHLMTAMFPLHFGKLHSVSAHRACHDRHHRR